MLQDKYERLAKTSRSSGRVMRCTGTYLRVVLVVLQSMSVHKKTHSL